MLGCSLWGRLNLNRTAGRSCTTVSGREVGHALLIRVESKPAYAEESMDLARQLPSLSEVQQVSSLHFTIASMLTSLGDGHLMDWPPTGLPTLKRS